MVFTAALHIFDVALNKKDLTEAVTRAREKAVEVAEELESFEGI